MPYENKSVLITGGCGGLGALLTRALLDGGARVTVIDRAQTGPEGTTYLRGDLSTSTGIDTIVDVIDRAKWDILINLAGIQHFGPVEAQSSAHLYASYMVNVVAPARLIQAVLPGMKARRSGQIVNVGSIFGSINFAHFATYSSAKAGLRGLSQALRREVTGTGIKVTYVAPRAVKTALNTEKVMAFARLTHMNMDDPKKIAARLLRAIRDEEKDVYLGFPESLFVRINGIFPGLVDGSLAANDLKARALFS